MAGFVNLADYLQGLFELQHGSVLHSLWLNNIAWHRYTEYFLSSHEPTRHLGLQFLAIINNTAVNILLCIDLLWLCICIFEKICKSCSANFSIYCFFQH